MLLSETLRFAVPMWQMKMQNWPKDKIIRAAHECASVVAESGDTLMFKGKTEKARQTTKEAFNRMAQGLACVCMTATDFDLNAFLDQLGQHEIEFRGD